MSKGERKKRRREKKTPPQKAIPVRSAARVFAGSVVLGLVLAVVTTLSARAWSGAAGDFAEAEKALRKAQESLRRENYVDAFREYSRAARLSPSDFRPYFGLGQVYERLDRVELALECYRKAVRRNPHHAPSRLKLAQTLNQTGRHSESIAILKSLLKEDPREPVLWWGLGYNELRLGRPEEAIRWFEKYTKALPGNPYGYAYLGRAHADLGRNELAEKFYRKALALNPNLFMAWLWLGQLLVATDRRKEAEGPLKRFDQLRSLEEKIRRLQRTLLRRPGDVDVMVELARSRWLLGRRAEALAMLERAMELQPENARLHRLYRELKKRLR